MAVTNRCAGREEFSINPDVAPLVEAIKGYDMDAVKQILEKQPELLKAADERGNAPIHWAVLTRQPSLIDYLLVSGADINAKRPDGARPLDLTNGDYHYRSWHRNLPAGAIQKHELLVGLEKGADPNLPADEPWALPQAWAGRRGYGAIGTIVRQHAGK